MKNKFILILTICVVLVNAGFSQSFFLSNCAWNASSVPSGGTQSYCVTISVSGSGSLTPTVTFQAPSGSAGWSATSGTVSATDMSGSWTFTSAFGGAIIAEYSGSVSDFQYATLCLDAEHDGSSANLNSNSTNVAPGSSTCSSSIPSPVTLLDFQAEAKGMDAVVSWTTASEINNDRFIVEYSLDGGKSFEKAGIVKGAGTTSAKSAYSFVHEGVAAIQTAGVYYRLTQVDFDGASERFAPRFVKFDSRYALYPSPVFVGSTMTLDTPVSGIVSYTIYNVNGEAIAQRTIADRYIPTDELQPGFYNLVINDKNVTLPFVVVR